MAGGLVIGGIILLKSLKDSGGVGGGGGYNLLAAATPTATTPTTTITTKPAAVAAAAPLKPAIAPSPAAPGLGGVDPHGIKKLFPSVGKVADWYMGNNLQTDPRVELEGSVKPLGTGVYEAHVTTKDTPASFRIHVLSAGSRSYPAQLAAGGADWATMARRGYFMSPKEWKNVEMTIYWNCRTNAPDDMSIYARGGGHGHGWPISCLGNCYISNIRTTGEPRFAKEYWHDGSQGYVFLPGQKFLSIGPVQNKWIGTKAIIKDIPGGVRIDTYVDTTGGMDPSKQNWRLMARLDDKGNLPGKPEVVKNCKATSASQILSWGGPSATFRIDSNVVDVKWASVREISADR